MSDLNGNYSILVLKYLILLLCAALWAEIDALVFVGRWISFFMFFLKAEET